MNKKSIIESITAGSPNRLREKYFAKYHQDVLQSILLFTKDIDDLPFKWRVWHWVHEVEQVPKCKCGNQVSRHLNISDGYRIWCSKKCAANDPVLRQKASQTIERKYGVKHYSQTKEYKEKVKETSIAKWGVDNYSKTEDYINKSKQTYLQRWGVDNFTKTQEYKIKAKETSLQKWGVESYTKTEECKQKIKKTLLERKGISQIFQDEEYRKNNFKMAQDNFYEKYLGNGISQFKCDNDCSHLFSIDTDNYWGRKTNNIRLCTVCNPISSASSIKEVELFEFIRDHYDGTVIRSYRDELEIDIFLPELMMGFEFNGLYWHSDGLKEKDYHLKKTTYFKQKGIRIVHIWEDDFTDRKEIIKSQIINLLKKNQNKIWARKCQINTVDTKQAKEFLIKNHIQGWVASNLKLGLYYNDRLVSIMTFDHYEGRKKMSDKQWNINRFCNLVNSSVVGAASKLLSYFILNYKPDRIISYADRDWSEGELYYKLGFKLISESNPDYKYLFKNKRIHKSRFRKSRIGYEVTENVFANQIGISKVWDCGKLKFEICLV